MGVFEVTQRTFDGYFNATALLEQWNNTNINEQRAIDNFWKATHLDKLMREIIINEPHLLVNSSSVEFTDDKNATDNQHICKSVNSTDYKNLDFDALKKIVAKNIKR